MRAAIHAPPQMAQVMAVHTLYLHSNAWLRDICVFKPACAAQEVGALEAVYSALSLHCSVHLSFSSHEHFCRHAVRYTCMCRLGTMRLRAA